ncbi:MAG: DUF3147 family protein [Bacteroidetes bacterium]|nr:DUF3147 family protein [Bacteroidota bacterium]
MITDLFLLQLLLTFFVGSAWIYLTVLSGTHFGSKIGGFIGGLPSTALLSFFFIGFTQSPEIASEATTVFPLAIGISGIFLVVYAWLVRRGFLLALFTALVTWFVLSSFIVLFHPVIFAVNLMLYALAMFFAYILLEKYLLVRSVSDIKINTSIKHLIIRSMFGGFVIMLTVLVAKKGGPIIGGIFTAFPAMFISTLTIAYKTHGIEFSRAMSKSLMVTGMITVAVYAVALRYLYVSTGLYTGTLLSVCISAISAYVTFRFILPELK